MFILLDTGTLGDLANPNSNNPKVKAIRQWVRSHLLKGVHIRVPEIADYECRRNLILETSSPDPIKAELAKNSLARLDALKISPGYLPLNTQIMKKAAELWADVRRKGIPTAHTKALDGDAILAAQAIITSAGQERVIIATDNLGDLNRFATPTVTADEWKNIT
jgi:predicted nucleic acid-binding protein